MLIKLGRDRIDRNTITITAVNTATVTTDKRRLIKQGIDVCQANKKCRKNLLKYL